MVDRLPKTFEIWFTMLNYHRGELINSVVGHFGRYCYRVLGIHVGISVFIILSIMLGKLVFLKSLHVNKD